MTTHESWTLDALIEAYKQHQRSTRGLREQTLHGYQRLVRLFVRTGFEGDPIDPARFSPSDVIEFVALLRGRYSPCSMKAVRTALRSFFRFLRTEGLCDERLEAAIPAVAHWGLLDTYGTNSSNNCLRRWMSPRLSGRGTAPSCGVSPHWGFGPVRLPTSVSMTLTGATARSG